MDEESIIKFANILWVKSIQEYISYKGLGIKQNMDSRKLHSEITADLALYIFDKFTGNFNGDFFEDRKRSRFELYFACLTHDIKKFSENHALVGGEFVYSMISSLYFDEECRNNIRAIIVHHKRVKKSSIYYDNIKKMDNELKTLILIERLADKLSRIVYKSNYKAINASKVDCEIEEFLKDSSDFIVDGHNIFEFIIGFSDDFKMKYC